MNGAFAWHLHRALLRAISDSPPAFPGLAVIERPQLADLRVLKRWTLVLCQRSRLSNVFEQIRRSELNRSHRENLL
jgi:hypothetical protein